MEEPLKTALESLGINVDTALSRFMGIDSILLKSLKLFLADTNIETLQTALENNNAEQAYHAMHTIKGVCGNLSMDKLFNLSAELCVLLKQNELEKAKEKFAVFKKEYFTVAEGLQKWI